MNRRSHLSLEAPTSRACLRRVSSIYIYIYIYVLHICVYVYIYIYIYIAPVCYLCLLAPSTIITGYRLSRDPEANATNGLLTSLNVQSTAQNLIVSPEGGVSILPLSNVLCI